MHVILANPNGGRPAEGDRAVNVDSFVRTFTVTLHSQGHVGPGDLKNLIQERYKVLSVSDGQTIVVA